MCALESGMKFGLVTPQYRRSWPELLELWQFAKETGWDSAWLSDHFFSMPGDELGSCFEAWTALAALSERVPRLTLGTLVSGITHRAPAILFKQAATVDVISGGRLVLGLGAAWSEREHEAHGLELPPARERVDRFGEALEIWRLLETQETTSYHGRYYQVERMPFAPKPVRGHMPILIGANGRRMLRHVARFADIWDGPSRLDRVPAAREELARQCLAIGRDPAEIVLSRIPPYQHDPDPLGSERAFREHVEAATAVGVRWLLFYAPVGPITRSMRAISEQVIPELRAVASEGQIPPEEAL